MSEPNDSLSPNNDERSEEQTGAPEPAGETVGNQAEESPKQGEAAEAPALDENLEGELEPLSELDQALLRVAELEEQLARATASAYNLQQEYNNYVRRSKADARTQYDQGQAKVIETLLSALDDAHLAKEHGDLTGSAELVVDKIEQTLTNNFKLKRFGAVGDPFDPTIHEALMHSQSAEVETEQIAQLISPGYWLGERVLRPARVGVVSPA